jgi:cystathionine beta-lyase/cystathionine gamma-synthase
MSYSLTKTSNNNYRYNRSSSNEYDLLCHKISSRYSNYNSIITSSGTSSLNLILKSLFIKNKWDKINIIYGWELYYETPLLIQYYESIYPNNNLNIYDTVITSVPDSDNEYLLELFNQDNIKHNINILFIESCSNMSGWCLDLNIIDKLRILSKKLLKYKIKSTFKYISSDLIKNLKLT